MKITFNLSDEQAQNLGEKIADLLELKQIKSGEQKGRFNTSGGTKTHKGLARTIVHLIQQDKTICGG
ncbi:MAG: hypothetical protein F2563_05160 [Actinobacteria bacterium]|uniref:Unannotated protein n=1 Tax=freshwater metagenome TaxID=449393 RepID=A0A6J6EZH7_9ZZZZ|nr:hypothetical protein [Actinomycetota bacterium]